MKALVVKLFRDESGGELVEYCLLMGLIVLVCLTAMHQFGMKVFGRWEALSELLDQV